LLSRSTRPPTSANLDSDAMTALPRTHVSEHEIPDTGSRLSMRTTRRLPSIGPHEIQRWLVNQMHYARAFELNTAPSFSELCSLFSCGRIRSVRRVAPAAGPAAKAMLEAGLRKRRRRRGGVRRRRCSRSRRDPNRIAHPIEQDGAKGREREKITERVLCEDEKPHQAALCTVHWIAKIRREAYDHFDDQSMSGAP